MRGRRDASAKVSLEADDFNAAVRIAEMCPIFDTNGWTEIARLTTPLGGTTVQRTDQARSAAT